MNGRDIIINTPDRKRYRAAFNRMRDALWHPGEESYEEWPEDTTWPDLLVPSIFSSRSECRRNGWFKIPEGWTDIRVGKRKTHFCILKYKHLSAERLRKMEREYDAKFHPDGRAR